LGLEYLISKINSITNYNCLILTPKKTAKFLHTVRDTLLNRVEANVSYENLQFAANMMNAAHSMIDADVFSCDHIVLACEDLLVLAFESDEVVDQSIIESSFKILAASANSPNPWIKVKDKIVQ